MEEEQQEEQEQEEIVVVVMEVVVVVVIAVMCMLSLSLWKWLVSTLELSYHSYLGSCPQSSDVCHVHLGTATATIYMMHAPG